MFTDSNVSVYGLKTETYKQRLIYLIIEDIGYNCNDITLLLLNGFKGFDNMNLDELEESVIDRDDIEQNEIEQLTVNLLKRLGKLSK